jgi:hypothetical protein
MSYRKKIIEVTVPSFIAKSEPLLGVKVARDGVDRLMAVEAVVPAGRATDTASRGSQEMRRREWKTSVSLAAGRNAAAGTCRGH